jgi:hypothetical protein
MLRLHEVSLTYSYPKCSQRWGPLTLLAPIA